jgi:hypothetical protein
MHCNLRCGGMAFAYSAIENHATAQANQALAGGDRWHTNCDITCHIFD